ncbi:MAG: hypothetical protein M3483_00620, partial [Gemmatimonadota bacterium]|nr:hypothetical protein [Gemmatimonadota bacterium]
MIHGQKPAANRLGRVWYTGLVAVAALSLGACDSLLDVDSPGAIPAANLNDPGSASLLLNGAIGDFECAFGSYVVMSGLIGEELVDATQTADRWPYDRRDVQASDRRYGEFGCTSLGVYTPLSTARWQAENILGKLQGWTDAEVPNRTSQIAVAAAYSGYSHLLLGEGFCSGVLLDAQLVPGGEVARADVLGRAIERFGTAIDAARTSGNTEILNTALVGRARAHLDRGNKAAAAADARLVPAAFVKNATASTIASRRENRVFEQNGQSQATSVGLPYR